ncbi:MAG: hypothetical protein KGJ32_15140 [Xanthomonadaceae bacterium]|nr:hypothetical protein [Xanthomonadaceae bacterium]
MDAVSSLTKYILALEQSASATTRAEDRSGYAALMADAAPLLAAALEAGGQADISMRISQHEKLWGNLWLQDPVFHSASDAWQAAKLACARVAI